MLSEIHKRREVKRLIADGNYIDAEQAITLNKLHHSENLRQTIEEVEFEQNNEWWRFEQVLDELNLLLRVEQMTLHELNREKLKQKMQRVMEEHDLEFQDYARELRTKLLRQPLSLSSKYLHIKFKEKNLQIQGLLTEAAKLQSSAEKCLQKETELFNERQATTFCEKLKRKRCQLVQRILLIWENELAKVKLKEKEALPQEYLAVSKLKRMENEMSSAHRKIAHSVLQHGFLPPLSISMHNNSHRGTMLVEKYSGIKVSITTCKKSNE